MESKLTSDVCRVIRPKEIRRCLDKMGCMKFGRLTLAIYNSYDPRKFHEAHRRSLARAGPIAFAFDCNLATFGFPYDSELKTSLDIAAWLTKTTTIGQHGQYLLQLAQAGRFSNFPFMERGFPPQLGTIVITTCHPDPKKAIDVAFIVQLLRQRQSVCLLFGVGTKGLPKKMFELGTYHLDITAGRGISLETCTALGAVPSSIMTLLTMTPPNKT